MKRLLEELRRRKVDRVMIAYAAAAFVVLQVADIVLPPLGVPDWVMAAVVALTALGFPVAFALAWAFDVSVVRTNDVAQDAAARANSRRGLDRRALLVVGVVAAVSLGASAVYVRGRYIPDPALDQNLVAVVPFRVSGDPALDYLREGMVDLFVATFTGEPGPRAADPRAVLGAAERLAGREHAELTADSALLVARAVGAGRVLVGSVVGTPREIVISASLMRVSGTTRTIEATERGPADQLTSLIDRITAQLLSLDAGEADQRLANLTSTSLPALRAYLAGQQAYRRSRFEDALKSFDQAVAHDSTFALAAMMLQMSTGWGFSTVPNQARAPRLAASYRDKLSGTDRALLDARIGPDYPKPRSVAQRLGDWERALEQLGDRPDAIFHYGDVMFHWGSLVDRADSRDAAAQAFALALAMDSSFTPALSHLLDNAIMNHDTVEARRLYALVEQRDTSYESATYQYWIRSTFLGDSSRLQQLNATIDTMRAGDLQYVLFAFLFGTLPPASARRAVEVGVRKALTPAERSAALNNGYLVALNSGRPAEAAGYAAQAIRMPDANQLEWNVRFLLDALFWDADTTLALRAAERLPTLLPAARADLTTPQRDAICALGLWHASRGSTAAAGEQASALEASVDSSSSMYNLCVLTLRALIAHHTKHADVDVLLARADSIAALGPPGSGGVLRALNFTIARLLELRGSPADALRAARRHVITADGVAQWSTWQREVARLADRTGDRATAIVACRVFLRIRSDAEPALAYQTADAHAALTRLTGDAR